ncbi:adenosylcobinamide kinase [Thiohalorhabdus denitrificans]|uniref:Bifunctional adenosylcobalamin biosynthesis protein n=1 Tax=Thiohalorhabdus denitrificans TaxID=381306 RepID=A0A0P9C7S4_9GAMM|nr:bifunctional adenosylcobinamide kinase/adenosylcobinamide-phosphate guanylyltransferase [Thiohalorhabdus denitrificans]KPV39268.1 adenosylcobinamide kinase [Thiohalorhabdus denitrificans]SCX78712.1 adenosylcobinamide kinase /adenosylcobinamide-phosphate guanylyltransferase [Thiohalorhabdus denitrificans]
MKELVLGGARSGKSRLAEQRAVESGAEVVYVATATAGDEEMAARIARHRADRPDHWGLVEEPVALARVLRQEARPGRCLLVDCLTLWLGNLLGEGEEVLERERTAFLEALASAPGEVLLVSNEVGQGVVPADPLSRRFVDEAGRLHQAAAERCEQVTLVVAGLPWTLKDEW